MQPILSLASQTSRRYWDLDELSYGYPMDIFGICFCCVGLYVIFYLAVDRMTHAYLWGIFTRRSIGSIHDSSIGSKAEWGPRCEAWIFNIVIISFTVIDRYLLYSTLSYLYGAFYFEFFISDSNVTKLSYQD